MCFCVGLRIVPKHCFHIRENGLQTNTRRGSCCCLDEKHFDIYISSQSCVSVNLSLPLIAAQERSYIRRTSVSAIPSDNELFTTVLVIQFM